MFFPKESDVGPRGGDQQPAHEGGREGKGTRPSGTGTWGGQSSPQGDSPKGGDKSGGSKKR